MMDTCILTTLPSEIIYDILQYLDLPTFSKLLCTNKSTFMLLNKDKWKHIDNMMDIGTCIPCNLYTYLEYLYCVDFITLLYNKHYLPDSVIINLSPYIDFELLSRNQTLSNDILYKFHFRIQLIHLLSEQVLPYDLLLSIVEKQNLNSADWHWVFKKQRIDINFIEKYISHVDWHGLSQNKDSLSLEILIKYSDNLIWTEITNNGISEDILVHFIHKFDRFSWNNISYTSKLSTNFILTYKQYLNIYALISCQELEEDTILVLIRDEEFYPKEDLWNKVASCQKMSRQFILTYIDNLQLRFMIRNKMIKRSILKEIYG